MVPARQHKPYASLLFGLLLWTGAAGAASIAAKDGVAFDVHNNAATQPLPEAQSGLQPADQPVSLGSASLTLDEHQDKSLSSGTPLASKIGSALFDEDNTIHPDPRPKMRKWMLTALLAGAIIRYLTSDAYRKFVSEVLDPLSWTDY